MFRSFQIIIREFHLSLLKLLHIHDLARNDDTPDVDLKRSKHVGVDLCVLKCFK